MSARERVSGGGAPNQAVRLGVQPSCHHRRKRFHIRPEALGSGYWSFYPDFRPTHAPAPSPPVEAPEAETEVDSQKEAARQLAVNGIFVCLAILGFIGVCLYAHFSHAEWIAKLGSWLPPNKAVPPHR